jgi:hypothetical protein
MADSKSALAKIAGFDWPLLVPLIIASGFAVMNPLLPRFRPNEPLDMFLMGSLFVEPVLFATWMSFGPGAAVKRVPLTIVTFVLVMLASVFNLWSLLEGGGTRGAGLLIPSLALFGLMACALSVVRWRIAWQIGLSPGVTREGLTSNRFSLKYLLVWMSVFAVLTVAVRGFIFEHSPPLELMPFTIVLACFLLMVLPATCISFVVLSPRVSVGVMLLSPLLWAGLAWLTIEAMLAAAAKFEITPKDRKAITFFVIMTQLGSVAAGLVSALMLRIAGFRLYRRRSIMNTTGHSVHSPGATIVSAIKPLYGKKEFARRGEAIYKRDIEAQLTDVHENHFVAIDIETGQFEVDADEGEAADRLLARIPAAQTWVRRIGSPYVRRFGPDRTVSS